MLTVYDLHMRDSDSLFMTKTLRETCAAFQFVPIHWHGQTGRKTINPDEKIAMGDRLTVIIALEDLQKLASLQRDRPLS